MRPVAFGRTHNLVAGRQPAGVLTALALLVAFFPAAADLLGPSPAAAADAATPQTGRHLERILRSRMAEIDPDHVLVRFSSQPADLAQRLARLGARATRSIPGTRWTEVATRRGEARRVRRALERDRAVAEVELSYIRRALTVPNDPGWADHTSGRCASTERGIAAPGRVSRLR
jgi:hypothetical protein